MQDNGESDSNYKSGLNEYNEQYLNKFRKKAAVRWSWKTM